MSPADSTYVLPSIPSYLQVTLLTLLLAGLIWCIIVWAINSPPSDSPSKERQKQRKSDTWWTRFWGTENKHEKKSKPVNKPSKYAPQSRSRTSSLCSWSTHAGSSGSDIALLTAVHNRADGGSLHQRPHRSPLNEHAPRDTPLAPSRPSWTSAQRSDEQYHERELEITSPPNPFLPPQRHLLRARSSAEYLAAHRTFFAQLPPLAQHSLEIEVPTQAFATATPMLDALEAQTERPTDNDELGSETTGKERKTKFRACVDAIEDGVDFAVETLARWTDDGEGEEGLLVSYSER